MNERLQNEFRNIDSDVAHAVLHGRLNGYRFVEYANDAAGIFMGFHTLLRLIEERIQNAGMEDGDVHSCALNDYEVGAMVCLMKILSRRMEGAAVRLSEQAYEDMDDRKISDVHDRRIKR